MEIEKITVTLDEKFSEALISRIGDAINARHDVTEKEITLIRDRFVDLVNSGNAFKLETVPAGSADKLLLRAFPTDAYLDFCAAIRAGNFNVRGV